MRWLTALIIISFYSGCIFEDPIIQEAVKKKDPDLCLSLESKSDMARCFRKVAVAAKDPRICRDYVKDRGNDRDQCFLWVGQEMEKLDVCDEIDDDEFKANCYKNVAVKKKSESVCEDITFDESVQSACYSELAVELNKPELCDKAGDKFGKAGSCYHTLAKENNRDDLCDKITEVFGRETCYLDVAKDNKRMSICDKITEPDRKLRCKGLVTGRAGHCADIKTETWRLDCYEEAAVTAGKPGLCENIQDEQQKSACYRSASIELGKPEFCDRASESMRQSCVFEASVNSMDPKNCINLKEGYHDSCLERIAKESGVERICFDIRDDERRQDCTKDVLRDKKEAENKTGIGGAVKDIGGSLFNVFDMFLPSI